MLHTLLRRPLAVLDLETTTNTQPEARICEVAVLRHNPDGTVQKFHAYVNPQADVHPEALKVHGLTNEFLRLHQTFAEIAQPLFNFLDGCDVGVYNGTFFDVPVLNQEFDRAGFFVWPAAEVLIIDACLIFKKQEPRTLAAAVQRYLGVYHAGAHGALSDAEATARVIQAQIMLHREDVGAGPEDWHLYCHGPNTRVDAAGKLVRTPEGRVLFNFGKHKGEDVQNHRSYVQWMLGAKDFARETLQKLREACGW